MAKKAKDELQRLELEEQIQEAIKRSTASIQDFADAQKKIVENYKIMQKINLQLKVVREEIEQLERENTAEAKEQLKILRQQEKALQQDLELIKATNKELSKGKNLAKSVGNELLNWGKGLRDQFIPSLSEVFNKFLSLNDLAIQTSVNIGMSGEGMKLMTNSIEKAQSTWGDLGFDLESSAKIQQSIADETGRQVVLSQQAQETAALTARALNMQADELGTLIGEMDQFGMGSELAMKSILDMRVQSEKMGVNSGKVIKKFQQNLELMNKLNFKDGIKGMQKMAALSEKYKIEMSSIAAAADKAFKPEGAIEMAAQLQTLGGSLAGLGDPFQLMYKARNNPEKFMEDITMAAKQSAEFDPKTGEFKVSAYEMDRLRVAAEATGISMDELVKTAKQGAKMDYLGDMMKGMKLTDEQKDMLSGMAEITEGGQVLINGKKFSDMSREDLVKLTERSTELKELAAQAQSSQKELEGIKNAIMIAFVNFFNENKDAIKGFLTGVKDFIIGVRNFFSPTGLVATTLALYFGPKVLWPIIQGRIFGRTAAASFNAGVSGEGKKGFFGRMMDKIRGKSPAMPGQSTVVPSSDKKDLLKKVQQMKGEDPSLTSKGALDKIRSTQMAEQSKQMSNVTNSTSKLGAASSVSAPQILALGAALLMVGGAIYLAATGLAKLVEAFKGLTGPQAFGAVAAIVAVMGGFVAIIYAMVPAIAALGAVGTAVAIPLLALGAAFLLIGGGIALAALGLSVLVESFTNMFAVIGNNGAGLFLAGLGFLSLAAGIGILTMSLIALGAASILALPGLLLLGTATSMLTETASAIASSGGGEGIAKAVDAINRVDKDKLDALKELSIFMSLLGASPTIKFDESLKIDGSIEISGEGGGKSNTDWVNDPVFISKLKQVISDTTEKERNGGRY